MVEQATVTSLLSTGSTQDDIKIKRYIKKEEMTENYVLLRLKQTNTLQVPVKGSFTILGLWVLGLAVSHVIVSNCKLMSQEHFFSRQVCNTIASWDSGLADIKTLHAREKMIKKMQDAQVKNHCLFLYN